MRGGGIRGGGGRIGYGEYDHRWHVCSRGGEKRKESCLAHVAHASLSLHAKR